MEVIYICGDYNIDLLKMSSNNDYCLFYENVLSSSFAPKITLPTRICETTSILIDNILYKRTRKRAHMRHPSEIHFTPSNVFLHDEWKSH